MSQTPYKRVLIKISGEQLAGSFDFGIDPNIASYFVKEVKKALDAGSQVALVVGGGNMIRGKDAAGNGLRRVTAEQMGMLSGLINCLCLTDIFLANGVEARCLSAIFADQVTEPYTYKRADVHLAHGKVVIIGAGIGRPYFTHDTAAVSYALELECQVMLKATKVDGVFDKDPEKYGDAKKIDKVTYQEALSNDAIEVMDKAALGLAMENKQEIIVFNPMTEGNIAKACSSEPIGTVISA